MKIKGFLPKIICANCDQAIGRHPKGETNDGGRFGPMCKEQVDFNHKRNTVLADVGGRYKEFADSLFRCKTAIQTNMHGFSPQTRQDLQNLFDLANLGLYYSCVQLKETADILIDVGLTGPNDDPWEFNKPRDDKKK